LTIQEIVQEHEAVALRQLFLASHYRSPMDFSREGLQEAARAVDRVYETIDRVERFAGTRRIAAPEPSLLDAFRLEMDDDFNTPKALALIFDEVRSLNRLLDEKKNGGVPERGLALKTICTVLGLLQDTPEVFFGKKKQRWLRQQNSTDEAVQQVIAARNQARRDKNWLEADRIRNELLEKGIVLEDSPGGTIWKVK